MKGLCREAPNVSWIIHDLTVVMTSTERFPKFKTCEVFQVVSKGHSPGQSWDKHHEKEPR